MPDKEKKEPEFLYVESARDDDRVALSEIDDAHPGGSIFVARGVGAVKVANTASVMAALRNGPDGPLLREVSGSSAKKRADETARAKMGDAEAARVERAAQEKSDDPMMQMNPAQLGKLAKDEGIDLDQLREQNDGKLTKTILVSAIAAHRNQMLTGVNAGDKANREGDKAAAGLPTDDDDGDDGDEE